MPYDFHSPGFAAVNAIEKELLLREQLKRQAMLDQQAEQQRQEQAQRAQAQLALQQQQEARLRQQMEIEQSAAARAAQQQQLATARAQDQAGVRQMAAAALYGGDLTPDRARSAGQMLMGAGMAVPGIVDQTLKPAAAETQPIIRVNPRTGEVENLGAAPKGAHFVNEPAPAGGDPEAAALRRDLLRMQIDEKQQKGDEAARAQQAKEAEAERYASDIGALVDELLDKDGNLKPEVAHIVGPISARTGVITGNQQTALSKLDRLISMLDIDTLRKMKAQSKTGASGFGALSERELSVLESAGATLRNRLQGEGNYAAELKRIRDTARKKPAAATSGGRVYYDANGNPVQR